MAYPKYSMGANDARNQKLAAGIYLVAFIVLHVLVFTIPANPHFHGFGIALTGVATLAVLWLASSFWKNSDLTEDFGWPELIVIVLAAAPAISIGWVGDAY